MIPGTSRLGSERVVPVLCDRIVPSVQCNLRPGISLLGISAVTLPPFANLAAWGEKPRTTQSNQCDKHLLVLPHPASSVTNSENSSHHEDQDLDII